MSTTFVIFIWRINLTWSMKIGYCNFMFKKSQHFLTYPALLDTNLNALMSTQQWCGFPFDLLFTTFVTWFKEETRGGEVSWDQLCQAESKKFFGASLKGCLLFGTRTLTLVSELLTMWNPLFWREVKQQLLEPLHYQQNSFLH